MGLKKNAQEFYDNVPEEQVNLLKEFRKFEYTHINGWRYIAVREGNPLVLLPGGFMNADMFFYAAQKIEGYRLMIPDSYVRQGIYSLNDTCSYLRSMITKEGFERSGFLGISAGGGLIQFLLSKDPEIVDYAILSHTGILDPLGIKNIKKTIKTVRLLPEFLVKARFKKTTVQQYPDSDWRAFTKEFIRESSEGFTKKAFLLWMKGNIESLSDLQVKEWNGPMLILTSEDDMLSYRQSSYLKKRYPNATVYSFEKGSHHSIFLFPNEYTNKVIAFLEEQNRDDT